MNEPKNPNQFPAFRVEPTSEATPDPFREVKFFDRLGFERVESKAMKLFANDLVSIQAMKASNTVPVQLSKPSPSDIAELWATARDGDGQLSPVTYRLVETGTPIEEPKAPETEKPAPVVITPAPNPPAGYAADPAGYADKLEASGDVEGAKEIREADGLTKPDGQAEPTTLAITLDTPPPANPETLEEKPVETGTVQAAQAAAQAEQVKGKGKRGRG